MLPRIPWFSKRPLSIHENVSLPSAFRSPLAERLPERYRSYYKLLPWLRVLYRSQQDSSEVSSVNIEESSSRQADSSKSVLTVVPALAQLNPLQDRSLPLVLSWQACIAWSFSVAFFGVFLAVPLRRQVIVKEQLTFPSGTATAQIIGVLHNKPLHIGKAEDEGEEGPRRRTSRGGDYQPLRAGDTAEDEIEGMSSDGKDKKVIDTKACTALTTSFVVSASYTVSFPLFRLFMIC